MIAHGGGRIIAISSRGAVRGEPDAPAYAASKAGLNAMTQSLARALAPQGVLLYVVAPGWVATDMSTRAPRRPRGRRHPRPEPARPRGAPRRSGGDGGVPRLRRHRVPHRLDRRSLRRVVSAILAETRLGRHTPPLRFTKRASPKRPTAAPVEIHPLTPERWPDLRAAVRAARRLRRLLVHVLARRARRVQGRQGEGNKRALRRIVDEGESPGVLAYRGGEPVGWCSIAPRSEFASLNRRAS